MYEGQVLRAVGFGKNTRHGSVFYPSDITPITIGILATELRA